MSPDEPEVISTTIPPGRYAKLTVKGSDAVLEASLRSLYSDWLPSSDEEPRDLPLFVQRVRFYPDVPEH
jgi:AraC family transcriptional regulator